MYKRPKSPTPNFTMINQRDPELSKKSEIVALVTKSFPIPNLLDKPKKKTEREKVQKKELSLWRNEVKK